ncbi:ZIP family metal transporter [Clostridium cylindrosporum]|uniref:Zinc uptake transporter n=1 Tax=Clostridium cylindrosporum DSM 605 TaxID=1121307 RepID=A0A0J8DF46_CLOCY|nr:ZIP family metal transporter [Clostridium cylindrosporum]KMT22798.1 zinc uptake transporter [Clostridium cylindrosporum DSM 605]
MSNILVITLIAGGVSFLGTLLGGIIGVSFRSKSNTLISSIMSIAAGLMIAVVTFDLIPEAIHIGGITLALIGIFVGVIFVTLMDVYLPSIPMVKAHGNHIKTSILLGISLAAHNFPEGLAIGSSFATGQSLGIGLCIIIGLHDIPEGATVAAPLLKSSMSRGRILLLTALTALPTAIGALFGVVIAEVSKIFITLSLGFAGGTMLYIVCGELIPESKSLFKGVFSTISVIIGLVLGLIITTIV